MKKSCDNCTNTSSSFCDDCWTSDTMPYWKPAPNYIPDTRIEKLRSMSNEEFVTWLVKTQFGWARDIYAEFGVEFKYTEDELKEASNEIQAWLLEPADGK